MLLSIVVPVYNVEAYVSRCIDSLISQDISTHEYEIVLVNDGSTDSSLSILQNYAGLYEHIKIVNQKNKGLSGARNSGVNHSLGTYILFVDSDDYIEKNTLNALLQLILTNDLEFLGFDYTSSTLLSNFTLNLKPHNVLDVGKSLNIYDGYSYIATYNYYNNAWWYVFKKELVIKNKIKFVEGILVEDGIYTTELLLQCKKAAYLPLSIYRYFENPHSIMRHNSQSHLIKLNNDFKVVITKFSDLIHMAEAKNANPATLKRLKTRQQSYLFFLIVRLLKSNMDYSNLKKTLTDFKKLKIYPLTDFIGVDYNSRKYKILTVIFNHTLLLMLLVKFNNAFRIFK